MDLLEKRKHDPLSLASANLLFKSLNMDIEKFMLSPNSIREHVAKQAKEKQSMLANKKPSVLNP